MRSALTSAGTVAAFGLVMLACGGGEVADPAPVPDAPVAATETTAAALVELADLGPHEPLVAIDGWLQSDVESLEELRGNVVVVQFWTFGCINCKRTLDNLSELYATHQGDAFEIVGIHSPEFAFEEDPAAIAEAAAELGVSWPIALDTSRRTFFTWQGSPAYWPRTYVLDPEGNVRFDHIGEGAYDELNAAVASLLG